MGTIYYLDYIELKNINNNIYKNVYKNNQFLENILYTNYHIILSKKIDISQALKKMYYVAEKYIESHYNPIYDLKNYLIRVIIDYYTFVIAEKLSNSILIYNEKLTILSPEDILSLIPNYDIYKIAIKHNEASQSMVLPKIVIKYINNALENTNYKTLDDFREFIRILLFIK